MVSLQEKATGKRTGPVASKRQPPAVPAVCGRVYIVPVPLPGTATGGVAIGPKSSFAGEML